MGTFKTVAGKAKGQLKQAKNRTEKKKSVESWWRMVDEIPPWAVMVALWEVERTNFQQIQPIIGSHDLNSIRGVIPLLPLSELCVYGFGLVMR